MSHCKSQPHLAEDSESGPPCSPRPSPSSWRSGRSSARRRPLQEALPARFLRMGRESEPTRVQMACDLTSQEKLLPEPDPTRSAPTAWTAPAPRGRAGSGAARGQGCEPAPSTCLAQTSCRVLRTPGRPSPTPAMTAARPHGPTSPPVRPKLGGVFRCVEDAFENKSLLLDAPRGYCQAPEVRELRCGLHGHSESPGEPEGGDLAATASPREQPGKASSCGPQQVEDTEPGTRAEASVRVGR